MSSEYHCMTRWIYLIHKLESLVPDERHLIDLLDSKRNFLLLYGICFESLHYDISFGIQSGNQ